MGKLRAKAKKNSASVMPEINKDWQAESDMRTLADAERIRSDKIRLQKAQSSAKKEVLRLGKVLK